MGTMITRPRIATPSRLQAGLNRALSDGIRLSQIAGKGEAVVTSQREPGTVYRTDGATRVCAVATLSGDPVCANRALFWF